METIVDRFFNENKQLLEFLETEKQPTFLIDAENNFKKNLLLSAASYYENILLELIKDFVAKVSGNNERLISFVEKKGIKRQYHTYFDWSQRNANIFWSLFGEKFKSEMESAIMHDEDLEKGVKAFLEIGKLRNEMVHGNYASYTFEKTATEVYELFQDAKYFMEVFRNKILNIKTG